MNQKLSHMRHEINNQLAMVVAALELLRYKPEMRDKMLETITQQPPRIIAEMAKFSADFEQLRHYPQLRTATAIPPPGQPQPWTHQAMPRAERFGAGQPALGKSVRPPAPPPEPGGHSVEMEPDDSELIAAVLRGDAASFEPLITRYQARVFATAHRYARRESEVEDIVQEVFIKAYQKLSGFRGEAHV